MIPTHNFLLFFHIGRTTKMSGPIIVILAPSTAAYVPFASKTVAFFEKSGIRIGKLTVIFKR